MSNNVVRLEFAQFGHFTKFKVFRSPQPMVLGNMPEPIADNLKTMFFVDSNVPDGDNYYRVEVEREGESILSEEMYVRVTNEWSPTSTTYTLAFSEASLVSGVLRSEGAVPIGFSSVLGADAPTKAGLWLDFSNRGVSSATTEAKNFLAGKSFFYMCAPINVPQKPALEGAKYILTAIGANTLTRLSIGVDKNSQSHRLAFRAVDLGEVHLLSLPWKSSDFNVPSLLVAELDLAQGFARFIVFGREAIKTNIPLTPFSNTPNPHRLSLGGWSENNGISSVKDTLNLGTEFYLSDTFISTGIRRKTEGYLAHKYGVTHSLPDNHPYKWVKPIMAEDNKPYGLSCETLVNKNVYKLGVSGQFDYLNYYVSETPFNTASMPPPKMTGILNTSFEDTTLSGGSHYVVVGSVKNGVEKLSDQLQVVIDFWTPSDLPFEIIFTSSDNVILVNNLVNELVDIGGGNRSFTQGDQARCPAFIEYGNFNAIRFDGINDFLGSIAANNFLAGKNCAWIFTVFKASSAKAQGVVGTRAANNGSGGFNIYAGTTQYPTKIGMLTRSTDGGTSSLTFNTEDVTDNFRMVLGYRDYTQTSQKVVIDAANSYTTTTPTGVITSTQATAPAVIGAETNGPLSPFNGDVCCVIIGTNPLTTQEQDKIFGWAAHKYGLTANLPSGHPYKTLAPKI